MVWDSTWEGDGAGLEAGATLWRLFTSKVRIAAL